MHFLKFHFGNPKKRHIHVCIWCCINLKSLEALCISQQVHKSQQVQICQLHKSPYKMNKPSFATKFSRFACSLAQMVRGECLWTGHLMPNPNPPKHSFSIEVVTPVLLHGQLMIHSSSIWQWWGWREGLPVAQMCIFPPYSNTSTLVLANKESAIRLGISVL